MEQQTKKISRSKEYDIIIKNLTENSHDDSWGKIYKDCDNNLDNSIEILILQILANKSLVSDTSDIEFYEQQFKSAIKLMDESSRNEIESYKQRLELKIAKDA